MPLLELLLARVAIAAVSVLGAGRTYLTGAQDNLTQDAESFVVNVLSGKLVEMATAKPSANARSVWECIGEALRRTVRAAASRERDAGRKEKVEAVADGLTARCSESSAANPETFTSRSSATGR